MVFSLGIPTAHTLEFDWDSVTALLFGEPFASRLFKTEVKDARGTYGILYAQLLNTLPPLVVVILWICDLRITSLSSLRIDTPVSSS